VVVVAAGTAEVDIWVGGNSRKKNCQMLEWHTYINRAQKSKKNGIKSEMIDQELSENQRVQH
jgi:hypothetical protein